MVCISLLGCSDAPGPHAESGSVETYCEDRIPSDLDRAQALQEQWSARPGFQDLYDDLALEPQAPIRCIRPEEFGSVMSNCMQAEGFDVRLTDDGEGSSWEHVPQQQLVAAYRAGDECELRYPIDPVYLVPLDDDQIERVYDHLVDNVVPCLADQGHEVAAAPSREVFVERYGTASSYSPFTELTARGADIAPLLAACPELPPMDELRAQ